MLLRIFYPLKFLLLLVSLSTFFALESQLSLESKAVVFNIISFSPRNLFFFFSFSIELGHWDQFLWLSMQKITALMRGSRTEAVIK